MRIAKLLVLSALLLIGNGVARAVDGNVWVKPTLPTNIPEVTEFTNYQEETEVYLYNVATHLFFTSGNNWATRASLVFASAGDGNGATAGKALRGVKVMFTRTDEAIAKGDGVVELKDDVKGGGTMMSTFAGGWNDVWTDNNTREDRFWKVTPNGDAYRISNVVNETDKFLGWDGTVDTRLYLLAADAQGAGIDWKIVAPEAYEKWLAAITPEHLDAVLNAETAVATYNEAMSLKAVLEEAEAINADVTAQLAVYNNTASTKDELTKAITDAKAAIQKREGEIASESYGKASVENPVDVTSLFITNPTFDGNDLSGWSGSGFGSYNPKENAERYNMEFDTWQMLEGLNPGVYKFNAHAFYRAGNAEPAYANFKANNMASRYAKMYAAADGDSLTSNIKSPFVPLLTESLGTGSWSTATDAETGVTYYIPNDMIAADAFFNAGYNNDNHVFMGVSDAGTLRVGTRKDQTTGGDWSIFDNFSLTYYGNSAEAYQMWLDDAVANLPELNIEEGTVYTQAYFDAYNQVKQGGAKATNKAEVMAALAGVDGLEENIELWKKFQEVLNDAKTVAGDITLDPAYTEELGDWQDFEGQDALNDRKLTNEELAQIIAEKSLEIQEAYRHPAGAGTDMTKMLVNPNFSEGAAGWTIERASGGNVAAGGTAENTCYEAWNNAAFDIYQVVENAPKGVYEISVQGFYRYGRTAYQAYLDQEVSEVKPGKAPVYIYMNDNQTSLTNVYGDPKQITEEAFYSSGSSDYSSELGADGTTYYFPNGMASAAIAFSDGMFTQSAYGVVAQEGDVMRIGVKGCSNQLGDSWSIWDNFKLTFQGFDNVETVQPILEKCIAEAEGFMTSAMGSSVFSKLEEATDKAKTAISESDGVKMFDALSALLGTTREVRESIELFTRLETANDDLANSIVSAISSLDVIAQAQSLHDQIAEGIEGRSFDNEDAEEFIEQIAAIKKLLGIPEGFENATDDNPADATGFIVNPTYDEGNNNGWTLDKNPGFNSGLIEVYNTNFDEYQELSGLPEGTYTLSAQGFYRYGFADGEYEAYTADPTTNNNLLLYIVMGDNEVAVPMPRLASDGSETHTSTKYTVNEETGEKTFTAGDDLSDGDAWMWSWMTDPQVSEDGESATGVRIINGMVPVASAFADGKFNSANITFKMGTEGNVRIGLKKQEATNTDGSWCIWDNWKLTYYGKNSTKEITGITEKVSVATPAKVEYFNLSGARLNKAQKGIVIMKQTMSDGSVKVKKVTVK